MGRGAGESNGAPLGFTETGGEINHYTSTLYGYTDAEYDDLLRRCGLIRVARFGDLEGSDRIDGEYEVVTATCPDR